MQNAVTFRRRADDSPALAPVADEQVVVIDTPDGLPGFEKTRHWSFERSASAVFGVLRSLDQAGVGLMVAEPWDLAPGYEPDLPDGELARIEVTDPKELMLLVVAAIAAPATAPAAGADAPQPDGATVWLNLAAPLAVNVRNHLARQIVLDRQGWPLRHPVTVRS